MEAPTFGEATATWARVGLASFGGPAGQIATMHRILVVEKQWIDEARFLHALSFCMLLPGPEAMQLATYVGWMMHGVRGGLVAGLLFVLPGLVAMLVLAGLHVAFGATVAVGGLLFGLKAAVLAVVAEAVVRLGRRALTSSLQVLIAAASFLALAILGAPFPAVVAASALVGWLGWRAGDAHSADAPGRALQAAVPRRGRRDMALTLAVGLGAWFVPIALLALVLGRESVFVALGLFYSKAAVVTFGGAYAVLAYVAQQAVEVHGWLQPGEMVDGLGLAETTPGPLVLVLVFVGVLAGHRHAAGLPAAAGGLLGGLVAAWATFVPCFLWIFLGAPHVERLRGSRPLSAALRGVTAAVVGVILNLTLWFAAHVLFTRTVALRRGPVEVELPVVATFDPLAALLAVAAAVALLRFKAPLLAVIAGCAVAGLLLRGIGG